MLIIRQLVPERLQFRTEYSNPSSVSGFLKSIFLQNHRIVKGGRSSDHHSEQVRRRRRKLHISGPRTRDGKHLFRICIQSIGSIITEQSSIPFRKSLLGFGNLQHARRIAIEFRIIHTCLIGESGIMHPIIDIGCHGLNRIVRLNGFKLNNITIRIIRRIKIAGVSNG